MREFRFIIIGLSIALSACAHQRQMTREEWLKAGQKTYSNISKEHLIKNAQKVLTLADGEDFKFADRPNGFTATRNWLVYVVIAAAIGTDYWNFEIVETEGKLTATLNISHTQGSVSGYAGGGQAGTVTTPTTGFPYQGTAIYEVFWSRLDYLLGLRNDWLDCALLNKRVKTKEVWGSTEPLCLLATVKNSLPDDLSDSEVERIFGSDGPANSTEAYAKASAKKTYLKSRVANHR